MKKKIKRLFSSLMVIVMIVTVIPLTGLQLRASAASYNADAAVEYARNHWNDGVGLCAEFVSNCLKAGGINVSKTVCIDLRNSLESYGAVYNLDIVRVGNWFCVPVSGNNANKLSKGDILFVCCPECRSTGNNYERHVAIYSGEIDNNGYAKCYAHNKACNNSTFYVGYNENVGCEHGHDISQLEAEVVHFSSSPSEPYANLGEDFYGVILHTDSWKPISKVDGTDNVYLASENGTSAQKWHFVRQDDGAYVISSCFDGNALAIEGGQHCVCASVVAPCAFWGGAYQQWYIIPEGDGYVFKCKHFESEGWYLDLYSGEAVDGQVIQINSKNSSRAQIWSVYKNEEVQLKAPCLSISSNGSKTTFNWNNCYGTSFYNLKIWKNAECTEQYHIEWNAKSGYSTYIPKGKYYAYVTSEDYYHCLRSNIVEIEINYADLGDDFYGVILNSSLWKPLNQNPNNEKVTLTDEYGVANQRWRFTRQEDGAYVIRSCYDGKALEMTDGIRTSGTQITTREYWGGYYQQWYIIPAKDGGYFLKSKHYSDSQNWVLDLSPDSDSNGRIVQIHEKMDSRETNQIWNIYMENEIQLNPTQLSCTVNSPSVEFKWPKVYGAEYQLKIWENQIFQGDAYVIKWNTSSGVTINLPSGQYQAYVDTTDYFQCLRSNVITFTVNSKYYNIAFDSNGGICSTASKSVTYNSTYGELPIPTRTGYTFAGWYTAENGGTRITADTIVPTTAEQTLYARWEHDTFTPLENLPIELDTERKLIYGENILSMSKEDLESLFSNDNATVKMNGNRFGTGSTISLFDDTNTIYDTLTVVVFGDTNGDSWYDGTDAMLVKCIAGGMLTKDDVGEAVWAAADCNHDGEINQADVDLLNEAGLLLSQIDQTKLTEELMSMSVYQEYINLIDQSPADEESEEASVENVVTESKTFADFIKLFFEMMLDYFKSLLH